MVGITISKETMKQIELIRKNEASGCYCDDTIISVSLARIIKTMGYK